MTDAFLGNFINQISLTPGSVASLDGEQSISSTSHGMSFYIDTQGANTSVTRNAGELGITVPSIVYFPDFVENHTSVNYPFPNYNQYDSSGNWNILVSSNLAAGTEGISPFLEQLLNFTNLNLPLLEVINFNLGLINTNIALGPLNTGHYLSEYLPVIAIILSAGLVCDIIVYKMTKNRQREEKKAIEK